MNDLRRFERKRTMRLRSSLELVQSHGGDSYQVIYMVRFREVAYVLHAFLMS